MKKQPLLSTLLNEAREQICAVEPHTDMESDCISHANAVDLLSLLIKWSEGSEDLRDVKLIYYRYKKDPNTAVDVDDRMDY
jgi:hypothetical protein